MDVRFDLESDMDAMKQAGDQPSLGGWCDRCRCYHAPRPAGEFTRHLKESAQTLADAIDADALAHVLKSFR